MSSAREEVRVARVHLPFARVGMCLDCEACFEIGGTCPACGSRTWMPLARFLESARRTRLVQSVESLPAKKASPRPSSDRGTQHLVIVARDREALFQHFKDAFTGNPAVTVVLDRRDGQRRGGAAGERRNADRRWKSVNDQLRVMGWAIVRAGVEAPVAAASR